MGRDWKEDLIDIAVAFGIFPKKREDIARRRVSSATAAVPARMGWEQSYCFNCGRAANFAAQTHRTARNGALVVMGRCGAGHRVSRIIRRDDLDDLVADLNRGSRRDRARCASRLHRVGV